MNISEDILKLRKQKGWTQSQLAEKLKTTKSNVSAWEAGTHNPAMDKLSIIYELLGKKIEDQLNKNDKLINENDEFMKDEAIKAKDELIEQLKKRLEDKDEIIEMLRGTSQGRQHKANSK